MPAKQAQTLAQEVLEQLGYGYISHLRSADCTRKERFVAQMVRASMVRYAKIVIVRPFVMLEDTGDIIMLLECLSKLEEENDYVILDMESNRSKYEAGGVACHIIV